MNGVDNKHTTCRTAAPILSSISKTQSRHGKGSILYVFVNIEQKLNLRYCTQSYNNTELRILNYINMHMS